MSKMIFKRLYIFSSSEKKAKMVEFSSGKNVITSSAVDGTDRGKSVIMRSLYHTMGADCFFDDKWNDANKTYIVNFAVDDAEYYMYRYNSLFKCFDNTFKLLFTCIERRELSEQLSNIWKFASKLPSRNSEQLEIAPPAYNYVLYFLDQDKQDGPSFESFRHLAQYANYKENLLYYHFGAFDDTYYEIIRKLEIIADEISKCTKEEELTTMMLDRIYDNIKDVSYSKDLEHLQKDVSRTKEQYNEIAQTLNSIRKKLIELRNDKDDLVRELDLLQKFNKQNEVSLTALRDHTCPLCHTELSDTLNLRIAHYSTSDDIVLLSSDRQISLQSVENEIIKQEREYSSWIKKLEEYEHSLHLQSSEVNDVLRHKGFIEIRDKTADDLYSIKERIGNFKSDQKKLTASKKGYAEKKAQINKKYYELMLSDKAKFGLEEIDAKSFEKITNTFIASGSNRPISTIIWYINLIRIKNIFSPQAVCFPIVFDSPNNAETDQIKKVMVYKYLFEQVDDKNQLIVSGIGFDNSDFENLKFDKIISLKNNKYELLCEEDYTGNIELLERLNRAML